MNATQASIYDMVDGDVSKLPALIVKAYQPRQHAPDDYFGDDNQDDRETVREWIIRTQYLDQDVILDIAEDCLAAIGELGTLKEH